MKRWFFLMMLVLAIASTARSQDGRVPYSVPGPFESETARGSYSISEGIDYERRRARDIRTREHEPWGEARSATTGSNLGYVSFDAKLSVTNFTSKTIKQVTWECTFINAATNTQMRTYTLTSRKRIAPRANATISQSLRIWMPVQPGQKRAQLSQVNRIKEIRYTDGSVRS